jgi:hypothetical protein
MSVDLNPVAVEREILRLSGLLDEATNKILARSRAAALADADYKVAHAKAYVRHRDSDRKVTAVDAEQLAITETQEEYRRKVLSEGVLKSAQEAARNIRSQLDALRSVNTNLRALLERGAA